MIKRGQEIKVSRIPYAQGYIWEGYWQEDPTGDTIAIPVGRKRKLLRHAAGTFSFSENITEAIWLDIGGYLIL